MFNINKINAGGGICWLAKKSPFIFFPISSMVEQNTSNITVFSSSLKWESLFILILLKYIQLLYYFFY